MIVFDDVSLLDIRLATAQQFGLEAFEHSRHGPFAAADLFADLRHRGALQGPMTPLPKVLMMELHKPAGLSQGHQFVIMEAIVPYDTDVGEYQGVIELETIHPTAKRIRIPMRGSVVEADTARGDESNTLRYAN